MACTKLPAAYVVGRVGQAPVSVFVLPDAALAHFPSARRALDRQELIHYRKGLYVTVAGRVGRNVVLVIGQIDDGRLVRVLQACGTYPDAPLGGNRQPARKASSGKESPVAAFLRNAQCESRRNSPTWLPT